MSTVQRERRWGELWLPFIILKRAIWRYYEDDGPFMARGLAFGLLIYCIPLALLTVSALSYTLVSSERALGWLRNFALALMPQFYDEFTNYLSQIVSNRGVLGLAGFISFFIVSSTTFGSLRFVLNRCFKSNDTRGIIHGKAMEVVMMTVTSLLTFLVIVIVYGVILVQGIFANRFPASTYPSTFIVGAVGSFLATVALFWFLYRFSPAKSPRNRSLLVGAVTAAALFEVSKIAFGWYVRSTQGTTAVYGTLSGLVFFFLWVYYSCAVFIIGAEVASTFDTQAAANDVNARRALRSQEQDQL
jgi:membrane protein